MNLPQLPDKTGKRGRLVTPGGRRMGFTIEGQIHRFQSDFKKKALVLQKIRFDDDRQEIRLGYYIIGKKPRNRGRWVWGQFATFMPKRDFRALYKMAEKRGWV